MNKASVILDVEDLRSQIRFIRGLPVITDADLARAYGVTTKALNQAVKRNADRFPADFMFRLTADEWNAMRSRVVTASGEPADMRSQAVTASRRNIGAPPYAFTEQGVAMLSSVLRSKRAVAVNVAIMRTFVQLRRLMDGNRELARKIQSLEKKYDEQFAVVFAAIKELIGDDVARKASPRRRIGF